MAPAARSTPPTSPDTARPLLPPSPPAKSDPVRYSDPVPYPFRKPVGRRRGAPFQRLGASLPAIRDHLMALDIVKPVAVAIGPYHHYHSSVKEEMEEAKHAAVEEFCSAAKLPRDAVLEKIRSVAASARKSYDDDGFFFRHHKKGEEEDEETVRRFAEMMLLDGCFLLQFMVSMCPPDASQDEADRLMSRPEVHTHIDSIARDIMLLENQIPWSVLEFLMKIRPPTEPKVPVDKFLDLMASVFDVGNNTTTTEADVAMPEEEDDKEKDKLKEEEDDDEEKQAQQIPGGGGPTTTGTPDHLLALFCRRQVGPARTKDLVVPKLSSLSSTAMELAEMGVKLTAGKTKTFGDINFKKRKWTGLGLGLFGELSLAPIVLNDVSACWLINMAAYEASLGATQADNFAVSSYVSVVALLMNREEDVHELRNKGIVHSAFTDEDTLDFFKCAALYMRVGHRYYQVFERLQEYRNKRFVWIAVHGFLYNNFKTIAAIFSIAGVLAGLFKTILSLKQPQN